MSSTSITEQYEYLMDTIGQISDHCPLAVPYDAFFKDTAAYILNAAEILELEASGELDRMALFEARVWNETLYGDIAGDAYRTSWTNPSYAASRMSLPYARFISTLALEMRGMTGYAYDGDRASFTAAAELFVQIYRVFAEDGIPTQSTLKNLLYQYAWERIPEFVDRNIAKQLDPDASRIPELILKAEEDGAFADNDLAYLYRLGEYVTPETEQMSTYVNQLPETEIERIAEAFVEGYRRGFEVLDKPFYKKKSLDIHYEAGIERIVACAIRKFEAMGLRTIIYRNAGSFLTRRESRRGFFGAIPSKQCDYDHRQDTALFLDEKLIERKLAAQENAMKKRSELAAVYGGPAVIELFGAVPFAPESKPEAVTYSQKQEELMVSWGSRAMDITHRYILPEERSFTIISFPTPEIGPQFEEIFNEVIRINTLDCELYTRIQQTLIDALDSGYAVHITGRNGNRTDLTVALTELSDPEKETLFENCVADVNIPAGEVFTSPKLKGTNGLLHVTGTFLEGLYYENLEIVFKDGMTQTVNCTNYDDPLQNEKYLLDNLLEHHESLPMGEFAIGTNTLAYRMVQTYGISDRMTVLIEEKTGPHFAIGDTCYSCEEDEITRNPNGKIIVAKENDCSRMRHTDRSKAYFQVHTDITIPYSELGSIDVLRPDGTVCNLISEGRFTLPGTEVLNEALDA